MADIIAFPHDGEAGTKHRHTVLIVDDEPVIRGFLCDYLNESGFHAVAVASGDEAAQLLESGAAIDLVFSDVRMPGTLDGFGLARWVMDNRPDVPVLLTSCDLGKPSAAQRSWCAGMVPKPYDFEQVVKMLHATLDARARCRA
jgi:CheY-like chemotaxis protein